MLCVFGGGYVGSQRVVLDVFQGCTIISIAHRIPTIIGFDRVVVMDTGVPVEQGTPKSLLRKSSSMFSSLVAEYQSGSEHFRSFTNLSKMGFATDTD